MDFSKLIVASLMIVGIGWLIKNANAQQDSPAGEQATVPAVIEIDGAKNPEQVSDAVKYNMFVLTYGVYRDRLLPQLSGNDDAILSSMATNEKYETENDNAAYMAAKAEQCASRHSYNTVQLGLRSQALVEQFEVRRENRYRKSMNALSPGGRQAVEDLIASLIVPGLSTGRSNVANYAKANPEEFLKRFETSCYVAERGELPPDMQDWLDAKNAHRDTESTGPAGLNPTTEN